MVDLELLNWGDGESEKTQVGGMFIRINSGRNNLVQWTARDEECEPGNRGFNPS